MKKNTSVMFAIILLLAPSFLRAGDWDTFAAAERERLKYDKQYAEYKKKDISYEIWLDLSKSQNGCEYEWGYPGWSLRGFYCHLKTIIPYATAEKIYGKQIFVSGPHKNAKVNLNSNKSFGHYDINFVYWLRSKIRPVLQDDSFIKFSKNIYDETYSVFFRNYYVTFLVLNKDKELKNRLVEKYKKSINDGNGYNSASVGFEHDYYFLKNNTPGYFNKRYDFEGNIVIGAIYFWLRRAMDGTDTAFSLLFEDILSKFDKEFLEESASVLNNKVFIGLANNLDKKFNSNQLIKLTPRQLEFLRNGIYASYNYQFISSELNEFFSKNIQMFCRSGSCGKTDVKFNLNLLNEIDKENIKLIKSIENSRKD